MWTPDEDVAREMEVQGKSMQEAYNEHKISDRLQRAHNDYRPCQYLVTEVRPELIICYLELKCNTRNNFEPYYFDADSVMGEVFQSRYQVVGKLGYGGYSTAWLCRDLM